MTCKYCNGTLAPLRSLTDGEFCCDPHREAFHQAQLIPAEPELPPLQLETSPEEIPASFETRVPEDLGVSNDARLAGVQLEPAPAPLDAQLSAVVEPVSEASPAGELPNLDPAPSEALFMQPAKQRWDVAASWRWLVAAWRTAPADLKAMAVLLPVLLAVAASPAMPKLRIPRASGVDTRHVLEERWKVLSQRISDRAAVAFTDDFRSGLDAWESRSKLTTSWSYDAAGFVQPGPLAILKPSTDMTDYHFEFLAEIGHKSLGCAFRARDLDNYYALKFIEVKSDGLPLVRLVRYAVINGKEGPHVEKALPSTVRADMLNRILVDVRGSDFTIMTQGEIIDFFSDSRLKTGGVGFFCSRGEKARLRWVEVSHQYDTIGRLCAYLTPFGLEGVSKN